MKRIKTKKKEERNDWKKDRRASQSFVFLKDLWLAKDNRFLNPKISSVPKEKIALKK